MAYGMMIPVIPRGGTGLGQNGQELIPHLSCAWMAAWIGNFWFGVWPRTCTMQGFASWRGKVPNKIGVSSNIFLTFLKDVYCMIFSCSFVMPDTPRWMSPLV